MSETADAAFIHITRAVTRVPPEERAGVIEQACVMMLGRLSDRDRAGAMVLLRHRFTPRGHRNGRAHDPPDMGAAAGSTPGAHPGADPVQTPGATPIPEGGLGGGFDRFWILYPRKRAKDKALKAWKQLKLQEEEVEALMVGLQAQRQWEQWKRGVIPLPATWLNQRRWCDAPDEVLDDAPIAVNLGEPIAWGEPGCLLRMWNDSTPTACTVVDVEPERLVHERRALAQHSAETWWREAFAQLGRSPRLWGKGRAEDGYRANPIDADEWLTADKASRSGVMLAVRVREGHYLAGDAR